MSLLATCIVIVCPGIIATKVLFSSYTLKIGFWHLKLNRQRNQAALVIYYIQKYIQYNFGQLQPRRLIDLYGSTMWCMTQVPINGQSKLIQAIKIIR